MPKSNTRGGKKHKRGKKNRGNDTDNHKGKVNYATDNQVYALVKKRYGGRRIDVECSDGKNRSAIIPGKMWKRVWMNPDDVLLCDLDATGDDAECYILQKYTPKEISILKAQGKITFDVGDLDDGYEFDDLGDLDIEPQQNADKRDVDNLYNMDENLDKDNENNANKDTGNNNDSDDIDIDDL
jgi:translation initiation factor 1A